MKRRSDLRGFTPETRSRHSNKYPFSGKIFCGACGAVLMMKNIQKVLEKNKPDFTETDSRLAELRQELTNLIRLNNRIDNEIYNDEYNLLTHAMEKLRESKSEYYNVERQCRQDLDRVKQIEEMLGGIGVFALHEDDPLGVTLLVISRGFLYILNYFENLVLREVCKEDLSCMRQWVNDWETVRYLSDIFLYPHTLNQTENFLNGVLEGKWETDKQFVIAKKDTLEYIGQIGLHKIDWKNRVAELGIVIGNKDNIGKGIGTEAIELLQYFAFYKMNLNKIELAVHDFNERAYKCYKKCGFAEEGRLRQKHYFDGNYSDSIWMGILKEEYEARESKIRDLILHNNKKNELRNDV